MLTYGFSNSVARTIFSNETYGYRSKFGNSLKALLYGKIIMVRIIKNLTMKLSIQTLQKTTKSIKHLSLKVGTANIQSLTTIRIHSIVEEGLGDRLGVYC